MNDRLKAYWTSWGNGNINSAQTILENCPELKVLFKIQQSTSSHSEGSVAKHILLVCEAANQQADTLPSKLRTIYRFAALLHDIGKAKCVMEIAPGVYSFPDHNKYSVSMARILLDRYTQLTYKDKEHILGLINNHDAPIKLVDSEIPIRTLRRISMECNIEALYNLAMANYLGRKAKSLRNAYEKLELFKTFCIDQNYWGDKTWPGLIDISQYTKYGEKATIVKSIVDWFYLTEEIHDELDGQLWLATQQLEFTWGTLFMTVGPPGSGKSSWINKTYSMLPVVSTDQIRTEVFGDIADQEHNDEVYDIAFEKIMDQLLKGKKVVYDATNLTVENRKKMIDMARKIGTHIVIILFTTSYDNCLLRLKNRKVLPLSQQVLDEMFERYDYVRSYEYDKIIYVN